MNFKQATDALLESVTLEDLASALGVSVQAIRQARAVESSTAHRSPPQGWERAVTSLARQRAKRFASLEKRLTITDEIT
jgi:hypothetical protein